MISKRVRISQIPELIFDVDSLQTSTGVVHCLKTSTDVSVTAFIGIKRLPV